MFYPQQERADIPKASAACVWLFDCWHQVRKDLKKKALYFVGAVAVLKALPYVIDIVSKQLSSKPAAAATAKA